MKHKGPAAIVLLAFVAGALAMLAQRRLSAPPAKPAPDSPPIAVGSPMPDLVLPDPDGQQHALSQWQGQRLLVNFWATWCGPCREEMPRLRRAQAIRNADKVQIIGIAVDRVEAVRKWLQQHPTGYPVLIDDPQQLVASTAFGNPRGVLPYSVLIGRDGRVRDSHFGILDQARLTRWLGTAPKRHQNEQKLNSARRKPETSPANSIELRRSGQQLQSGPH